MPTDPSAIELSALNGINDFQINGEAYRDYSGLSVAGLHRVAWVGVRGDGFRSAQAILRAFIADIVC